MARSIRQQHKEKTMNNALDEHVTINLLYPKPSQRIREKIGEIYLRVCVCCTLTQTFGKLASCLTGVLARRCRRSGTPRRTDSSNGSPTSDSCRSTSSTRSCSRTESSRTASPCSTPSRKCFTPRPTRSRRLTCLRVMPPTPVARLGANQCDDWKTHNDAE